MLVETLSIVGVIALSAPNADSEALFQKLTTSVHNIVRTPAVSPPSQIDVATQRARHQSILVQSKPFLSGDITQNVGLTR